MHERAVTERQQWGQTNRTQLLINLACIRDHIDTYKKRCCNTQLLINLACIRDHIDTYTKRCCNSVQADRIACEHLLVVVDGMLLQVCISYFSSTSTLAPFAAICVAVVRPPMPPPTMIASYSTSASAWSVLAGLWAGRGGASATCAWALTWRAVFCLSHFVGSCNDRCLC